MRDPAVAQTDVVVVGAGIAGLAAAYALVRDGGPSIRVTVLEAARHVGGKLALAEVGGRVVDTGAESMLARRPEGLALAAAVGLDDDVVHPAVAGASVWSRGALRPLPRGLLMGIPTDLRSLASSQVMSLRGLLRVPLDQVRRRTSMDGDVAIGPLVAARVGREVVDRLVEPLLGGVYAGHADQISLDAALPQLAAAMRLERSLLDAASRQVAATADEGPVFASVEGGLGRLPITVANRLETLGVDLRTRSVVRELHRAPEGWRLVVGETRAPTQIHADAVVLAVPAAPASRLLAAASPRAASALAGIESASVAIVTVVLPAQAAPHLRGTGFLVPPVEGRAVKAATYSSSKWAWVHDQDPAQVVLRMSVGRHHEQSELQRTDEELVSVALTDLAEMTGITQRPLDALVTRWGGALPQYAVGHVDVVDRIRAAVWEADGLAVCGAAYDGVGVPACIASAERAAAQVLRTVGERRQWRHG